MTDETEVEDDEDDLEDEESPEQTDVMAGTFTILDTARFATLLNCVAVQVTQEDGVYVVDAESGKLRAVLLDDGKTRPKVTRIQ